jgi:hypothetical protein
MNHINLGFYYGADLPDPDYLLQGTGKMLRHIKILHIDQLEDPALLALVEAASKHLPKKKVGDLATNQDINDERFLSILPGICC